MLRKSARGTVAGRSRPAAAAILTILVAATAAAASPASAQAAHRPAAAAPAAKAAATPAPDRPGSLPRPHVTVLNLHPAYAKALAHARPMKIFGIFYARGKQPPVRGVRTAAGCTEPDCPLAYHGGLIQYNPKIYLVLWGPGWLSDPVQQASSAYLAAFYSGLGAQPQDNWSTIASQYGDSLGFPTVHSGEFAGAFADLSTPPAGATLTQFGAEADAFYTAHNIDPGDAQVVIATQSGTCPQVFACPGTGGLACGWHSEAPVSGIAYIGLPYEPDAGSGCDAYAVYGPNDGFSIVGGHEYAETATDPVGSTGWVDLNDPYGGEIGDKCELDLGTVALSTGTFPMQELFSNTAYSSTQSGCVLRGPSEDSAAVFGQGDQSSWRDDPVYLPLTGYSRYYTPFYRATGLPPGLSVSVNNGLISGNILQPGTYHPTIEVSDPSGASGTVSFTWTVGVRTVTIQNPGNQSIAQGASLGTGLELTATTNSGAYPLTWHATGLPPGLSILGHDPSALIQGTATTAGSNPVTVTATDPHGTVGSVQFTWQVRDSVSVTNPGNQSTVAGVPVSLQIHATSSSGLPLSYAVVKGRQPLSTQRLPGGLSLNTATGLISGTPLGNATQSYQVQVAVTDSSGAPGSAAFTWTITVPCTTVCRRLHGRTG
jgi:Putative Ig domain